MGDDRIKITLKDVKAIWNFNQQYINTEPWYWWDPWYVTTEPPDNKCNYYNLPVPQVGGAAPKGKYEQIGSFEDSGKKYKVCWVGPNNLEHEFGSEFGELTGIISNDVQPDSVYYLTEGAQKATYNNTTVGSKYDVRPTPYMNVSYLFNPTNTKDPTVPALLNQYMSERKIANPDAYNEFMSKFLFSVSNNCDLSTNNFCPLALSKYVVFQNIAANWRKNSPFAWDIAANDFCKLHFDKDICGCLAAEIPGSTKYEIAQQFIDPNGSQFLGNKGCYLQICKEPWVLKDSIIDNALYCQAPPCSNIVINVDSILTNSDTKQEINCVLPKYKYYKCSFDGKCVEDPTSSSYKDDPTCKSECKKPSGKDPVPEHKYYKCSDDGKCVEDPKSSSYKDDPTCKSECKKPSGKDPVDPDDPAPVPKDDKKQVIIAFIILIILFLLFFILK